MKRIGDIGANCARNAFVIENNLRIVVAIRREKYFLTRMEKLLGVERYLLIR